MKVNESRTVVGGLIGHSTGRRSLSTVGGTHVCPSNRGERSTRMTNGEGVSAGLYPSKETSVRIFTVTFNYDVAINSLLTL